MEFEVFIFKKLIWSWIKILSEITTKHFPAQLESVSPLSSELMNDFNQFIALADHLEMRLSVCPREPWSQFQWDLDFKIFLKQLMRRSHYCLSHLVSLFDSQYV